MTTDITVVTNVGLETTTLLQDTAAIKAAVSATLAARTSAEKAADRAVNVEDASRFEIARRLLAVNTHEKWREAGYRGFKAWVEAECSPIYGFGTVQHAYRLMKLPEVVESVTKNGFGYTPTIPVENEGQARALGPVDPNRRSEVLQKAAAAGKVTAASITAAAETIDEPEPVDAEVVDEWVTCPHCGGTGQVRA